MASAADVPTKYDVVVNGHGYTFLRSLDGSYLTSGRHHAQYGYSPTFLDRTNVSGDYGDNQQAFWMTATQRDWSLGEQLKHFRSNQPDQARRFWRGTNIDVRVPGQATIRKNVGALTFANAVTAVAGKSSQTAANNTVLAASTTHLYEVDAAGTVTDDGLHGLGAAPARFGLCTDGQYAYLTVGTQGVRRWDGAAFTTFSASGADSIAFLNNTMYGFRNATADLVSWDTSGALTSLYPWKRGNGDVQDYRARVRSFGSHLAVVLNRGVEGPELWIYDGTGTSLAWEMPLNFYANDCDVAYGVLFVSGAFIQSSAGSNSNMVARPAILYYANGSTGTLWEADDYSTSTFTTMTAGPYPGIAPFDNGIVFNDDTRGVLYYYDFKAGGVQSIGSYTVAGNTPLLAASQRHLVHTRSQTAGYFYPDSSTVASTATISSSLIDFESSLAKDFRGITIDADIPTGATVDIAYQIDALSGAYTTLQTSAAVGTEYLLTSVSGVGISVKITLNKGSSTAGPTLKKVYVRAVPRLQSFRQALYNLDLTNDAVKQTTTLNDATTQTLSGREQLTNVVTAIESAAPITITDKLGTFTGICDTANCQILEIHGDGPTPAKAGQFIVQLSVREV